MSNDIPPLPRHLTHNYDHDFTLAQFANAAMYDRAEIERATADPSAKLGDPVLPRGWRPAQDDSLAVLDNNSRSGLVAMTFVNRDEGIAVIAFRGYDNPSRDAGAVVALAADGEMSSKLIGTTDPMNIGPRGDAKADLRDGQRWLVGIAHGEWHPQFAEALDHVARVREAYPGYDVQVTGTGPGGGIAELAAYTFGLNGRSFDPLGARNVIESPRYHAYLEERGLEPRGLRAPDGTMDAGGFASWNTKRSTNSWLGGEQLAPEKRTVSPAAGRDGVADWAAYGVGFAADFGAEAPLIGKVGRLGKALDTAGDLLPVAGTVPADRERMGWMVKAMEETARAHAEQWFGEDRPRGPADPRAPTHPDHAALERIRAQVQGEDARLGRAPDERSENLAASLLLLAKREGIEPNHIAFSDGRTGPGIAAGEKVFVYDRDPDREPWYDVAGMQTADAVRRPAAESFHELETVNRGLAERRAHEQALAMASPAAQQTEGIGARSL